MFQAPGSYPSPPSYPTQPPYPSPGTPPPAGMSGCLKVFLVLFAVGALGAIVLVVSLVVIGGHVVHQLSTNIAGTAGRPGSLPSSASDYNGERRQDHVAGSGGVVAIGSLSATATSWARTTDLGVKHICGNVTIHRSTVTAKDPFDAALQLAGDFAWELVPPTGPTQSFDPSASSFSALSDYLTTNQTGDATGKVCFPDPGGAGQFVVTWQPRLLRAERAVWIVTLS
jgi:hypothetical protein